MSDWETREHTVTLTGRELFDLVNYIDKTKMYRQDNVEMWERLAAERDDAGAPRYIYAEGNVQYLTEQSKRLEALRNKLDGQI
ncbi:MAG: hypothetical protein LUD69_07480 [Oscillospiraceae bacterium]|nr:hypothetical protein [Oscillospiraceae bacterium]